jgi:hypothetical protein
MLDQLAGHVAHALLELGLARLPAGAAQPVELRAVGVLASRSGQQLDVLDRQEELVAAGVEQAQAVVRRADGSSSVFSPS